MATWLTAAVWIFMTLIISVVHRSNLKAMLISPKLRLPFDSLEEFLETNIPALVLEGSMMDRLSLVSGKPHRLTDTYFLIDGRNQ